VEQRIETASFRKLGRIKKLLALNCYKLLIAINVKGTVIQIIIAAGLSPKLYL
jgi:hypothetical protein